MRLQGRSHPTLCYTSSLLLSSLPASQLLHPLEPLDPLLLAVIVHPSLPQYTAQLRALLQADYPALAASCSGQLDRDSGLVSAREAELNRLAEAGGGEEARAAFKRVWSRGPKEDEEDREAMGRDVRSL